MVALRPIVYVHFPGVDEFVESPDLASAKSCIREMYPEAVFSNWQLVGDADVIVAWADVERRMQYLLGEEATMGEPVAYVICQAWPLDFPLPSDVMDRPAERRVRT